MTMYYSERLGGPRSRTRTEFDERSWGAVVAYVNRGIARGVYAQDFPELCVDGHDVYGTDEYDLRLAVRGEHPEIEWPLRERTVPEAPVALDLIEFLYRHASEPTQIPGGYHSFQGHHHLTFNRRNGQKTFRGEINTIFARSGLAYELDEAGQAQRLLEPALEESIRWGLPPTGDGELDELIALAEERFLDPDPQTARDALEKLWDAFERAKSLLDPTNKKRSARALAEASTSTNPAAELFEAEMNDLTKIGNEFRIRHHEVTKHPVPDELVEYLFLRMYIALRLLLTGVDAE
jgi:hypothetical protein